MPARRDWDRVDRRAHRQRGVSLGIVAAMLIVVGALTVLGNALFRMRAESAQTVSTAERLDLVVRGLSDFAILHKRLPCPAPGGERTGTEVRLGDGCDDQSGGVVPVAHAGDRRKRGARSLGARFQLPRRGLSDHRSVAIERESRRCACSLPRSSPH